MIGNSTFLLSGIFHPINQKKIMENIIKEVSKEIAREIITRPNFDLEEIANIINFRIKESMLDILLSNVEKEEITYHRLLLEQSSNRVGSKQYVDLGYKLAIAKNKKSIANRAVNNVRNNTKIAICYSFIKGKLGDDSLTELYELMNESEGKNG
jgi:hypothetical protein